MSGYVDGVALEGLLEGGEFVEHAAEAPDVDFVVVVGGGAHFGGEVVGRAD